MSKRSVRLPPWGGRRGGRTPERPGAFRGLSPPTPGCSLPSPNQLSSSTLRTNSVKTSGALNSTGVPEVMAEDHEAGDDLCLGMHFPGPPCREESCRFPQHFVVSSLRFAGFQQCCRKRRAAQYLGLEASHDVVHVNCKHQLELKVNGVCFTITPRSLHSTV